MGGGSGSIGDDGPANCDDHPDQCDYQADGPSDLLPWNTALLLVHVHLVGHLDLLVLLECATAVKTL